MSNSDHRLVRVAVQADDTALLSKEQKAFNRWTEKIAKQRELLKEWQDTRDAYHARYTQDYLPLVAERRAAETELLRLLDAASDTLRLGKVQKATLSDYICSMAANLLGDGDDAELSAIFERHNQGTSFEEEQRAADEELQHMMSAVTGVPLENAEGEEPMDPEAWFAQFEQKLQDEAEARERMKTAARKPSAKAKAKQAQVEQAAQQASRSVREVYRQLASALHPDREPDAAERERKTVLMQQVNAAYDAKDLLRLLELQLQIEQIDAAKIRTLDDARLKHYNQVLATQSAELKLEIEELESNFRQDPFDRSPLKPAFALKHFKEGIADLRRQVESLKRDLPILRDDPDEMKGLIRSLRRSW